MLRGIILIPRELFLELIKVLKISDVNTSLYNRFSNIQNLTDYISIEVSEEEVETMLDLDISQELRNILQNSVNSWRS